MSGGFVNSDLAALAGGDIFELQVDRVNERHAEALATLRAEFPFFFDPEFPIPATESRHTNP